MSFTLGSPGKLTWKKSVLLVKSVHSWASNGPDITRIKAAVMSEIRRMICPPNLHRCCQKKGCGAHNFVGQKFAPAGCGKGSEKANCTVAAVYDRRYSAVA